MDGPNNKPKEGTDEKPKGTDEKPKGTDEKPKGESEEGTTPDPFERINARLTSMEQAQSGIMKAQSDMMKAISAIANQGAVNNSIDADNGETDDDEYPDIDLDSLNRLIGD